MIRHTSRLGAAVALGLTLTVAAVGCVFPKIDGIGGRANPFAAPGFHAVAVYEQTTSVLPLDQETMLGSTAKGGVRDYLDTHAQGGRATGYRLYDPGQLGDLSKEPRHFAAAVKWAADKGLQPPYLIAANGKGKVFAGPLPANTAACLQAFQQAGGP